jgi:2-polyprenyl-6-methoxyphenol hydroxylase-like FAD-dependent oxidoreductase
VITALVVGSGPKRLAAAVALRKEGVQVTVLERPMRSALATRCGSISPFTVVRHRVGG